MITATATTLGALLSPQRRYFTPAYQRPYAWTTHEVGRLLADLRGHLDAADGPGGGGPPYFIGSMVFVNADKSRDVAIVDGQQRLLTLTIILAVLRDLDPNAAEEAAPKLLASNRWTGAVTPLVAPRARDAAFFQRHIQNPGATDALHEAMTPETDAQSRMLENALWLRRRFEKGPSRELRWLAEVLVRRCVLVETAAPTEAMAHHVFTVMNDRGLDLRVNDVLKADVIGALPEAEQPRYAEVWEDLEAQLGVDAFTQLFSHLRTLHRPKRGGGPMLSELREALRPATRPAAFIEQELGPKGRAFLALRGASVRAPGRQDEADQLTRSLNRLPSGDWATPAIAFFSTREPRGDETCAFLGALERLALAMALAGADDGARFARYRKLIEAIQTDADTPALLAILELTPNEREVARQVLTGSKFYQKERVRLPVLLRLDEQMADSGARYDAKTVTVEHVLPRNPAPDSDWIRAFPDKDERRDLVDRLGNLTLLSRKKNNTVANLPFERKKHEYFAAGATVPFAMTTRLLSTPAWTPETLRARQKELETLALELWRL